MKTNPDSIDAGSARWPLIALTLVIAAWIATWLIGEYGDLLREQWGPAPDVVDALGRDSVIGRKILPFYTGVLVIDAAALACLIPCARRGWPMAVKVLAAVLCIPSCALHGLAWFITSIFAS
jgi:hypothetical protein